MKILLSLAAETQTLVSHVNNDFKMCIDKLEPTQNTAITAVRITDWMPKEAKENEIYYFASKEQLYKIPYICKYW